MTTHPPDDVGVDLGVVDGAGRGRWAPVSILLGALLVAMATFVPVMQWSADEIHETAGSARVWWGEGYTLSDGGFAGAALVPISAAASLVLALTVFLPAGRTTWWVQAAVAALVAYQPAWVAVAFLRKLEDQVRPDLGLVVLAAGCIAIAIGLWASRPGRSADRYDTAGGGDVG